jgi:hypothetical protein
MRRLQILQLDRALELGLDRPDLQRHHRFEVRIRLLLKALAAGNAFLQHFRIVQRFPDFLDRRLDALLALHVHCHDASSCWSTRGTIAWPENCLSHQGAGRRPTIALSPTSPAALLRSDHRARKSMLFELNFHC